MLHNCFRNKTFIQYDSVKKYKSGVTMFAFKKHVLMPLRDFKHFMRHGWFDCIKRLLLHVIYFQKTLNSRKYNSFMFCNIYRKSTNIKYQNQRNKKNNLLFIIALRILCNCFTKHLYKKPYKTIWIFYMTLRYNKTLFL